MYAPKEGGGLAGVWSETYIKIYIYIYCVVDLRVGGSSNSTGCRSIRKALSSPTLFTSLLGYWKISPEPESSSFFQWKSDRIAPEGRRPHKKWKIFGYFFLSRPLLAVNTHTCRLVVTTTLRWSKRLRKYGRLLDRRLYGKHVFFYRLPSIHHSSRLFHPVMFFFFVFVGHYRSLLFLFFPPSPHFYDVRESLSLNKDTRSITVRGPPDRSTVRRERCDPRERWFSPPLRQSYDDVLLLKSGIFSFFSLSSLFLYYYSSSISD